MPRLRASLFAAVCAGISVAQEEPAAPTAGSADPAASAAAMLRCADGVMKEIEELRGYAFKRPVEKAVKTKPELRAFLEQHMEKEFAGGRLECQNAWLQALGLLRLGEDLRRTWTDVLMSQIGGFYDPATRSFHMMAETAVYGEALNRVMIAHELCHALDDQYVDLENLLHPEGRRLSEDESYVVGGVVEGSATALMMAYMAKTMRGGGLGEMAKAAEQQKDQAAVLLAAPPYCALLVANYMVGCSFLQRGKQAGALTGADTGAAVLEVARNMPRSSEQLLHPEKYWDEAERDEPMLLQDEPKVAAAIAAASGSLVLATDTLGELVAALVASPARKKLNMVAMARADYWTNKAARGWGGDRLFVLGSAPAVASRLVEAPGVVWLTAWDTEEDRAQFVEAVAKHRGAEPGFAVAESGMLAAFGFGSARGLGAEGLQRLLGQARFERAPRKG